MSANRIRNLIIAVTAYTQSKVYVIGNSLGGAVSRKAILGGQCVDTHEDLGPPLTDRVESYLGVAGAMRGSVLCMGIFSDLIPICNRKNGLNENSDFIKDINSQSKYESSRVLILESRDDDMIGFEAQDGTRLMEVDGADKIVVLQNVTHERTVFGTQPLQYDFLVLNKTNVVPVIPTFVDPNQLQL
uniref:Alpha/beta-hydrolase n=1 Tax=Bursaphelenchus xylophilus TaxID=6326 RepID=A0A1I7RYT1_BURXY